MTASKLRQFGDNNRDWLLTLLTVVLTLMIFVFAPLQAADIIVFQTFAIAGLLPIIAGVLIISGNPIALGLMSIAFIANFVVLLTAVLSMALQPSPVGRRMVDHRGHPPNCGRPSSVGGGRITYHRIVGATLLYLLLAVTFATLFAVVGLSIADASRESRLMITRHSPVRFSI